MKSYGKYLIALLLILNLIMIFFIINNRDKKEMDFQKLGLLPLVDDANIDTDKIIIDGTIYSLEEIKNVEGNFKELEYENTEITLNLDYKDDIEIIFPKWVSTWYIDKENEVIDYSVEEYYPDIYKTYDDYSLADERMGETVIDADVKLRKYNIKLNGEKEIKFALGIEESDNPFINLRKSTILRLKFK